MRTIEERQDFFKKVNNHIDWGSTQDNGFLVVMSARNEEDFLPKNFESIEMAMLGKRWAMVFADDYSTDNTLLAAKKHKEKSKAECFDILAFDKAENVACAKNRAIKKSLKYFDEYQSILLHDADDLMGIGRAKGLFSVAQKTFSPLVVGSWEYNHSGYQVEKNATDSIKKMTFGPWATLMHRSMIPLDGELFYEGRDIHEDLLLWRELVKCRFYVSPADHIIAAHYNARVGSTSKPREKQDRFDKWDSFKRFLEDNELLAPFEDKKVLNDYSLDEMDPLRFLNLPDGFVARETTPEDHFLPLPKLLEENTYPVPDDDSKV